jgi:hypothetical protein
MFPKWAPLIGVLFSLTGCVVVEHHAGPTQHDFRAIDRDSSETVRVHVKMGAGNLRIGSGTEKLLRADFEYDVPSWKPDVQYSPGVLRISQPETSSTHFGNNKYEWDLRLNRDVALDLDVNFGAGEAHLDLGSLSLRRVDVHMGVGSLQMDLRGNPKRNYEVSINGGVGEATVRLPSDVGIYAEARGGIGEVSARGLHRDGSTYFNDAYRKSPVTIKLDIHGGVGSIKLVSD